MRRITWFLFVLLSLVATAPFISAVPPNCDPFATIQRTNQSTCSDSTIEYGADGDVLTLTASVADCASAAGSASFVSVFFSQLITPIIDQSSDEWTLSYSIMWNDPSTNCVVDVTSTSPTVTPKVSFSLPNDANGLNNNPLTNISEYALNQWYTRSFVISGLALPSFRFGFTCASQTPGSNMKQVAFVKDITWTSGPNHGTVYNSHQSCVDCVDSPIEGSDCLYFGDEYRWVYEGDINAQNFNVNVPLTVIGSVTTNWLTVRQLLDIRGCLVQKSSSGMIIVGFIESTVVIRQNPECGWPDFYISPLPEHALPSQNDDPICGDSLSVYTNEQDYNSTTLSTLTEDSLVIYVPRNIFYCTTYYDYAWIAIIIVPTVVGVAGIILAIVFGVRHYRQKQRAKQLDILMEEQAGHVDPIGHCTTVNKD
eukprot:TRINITY_DN1443_c0_g1_i1.p1 TRINITY_DN1443_c0_g1~~TRINITY_DN1443_c0_g1_i1.p1  ORF type:complete len:435 (+),score=12.03 TRINITY_DN1443_c0_g1_i1:36-1307(+)